MKKSIFIIIFLISGFQMIAQEKEKNWLLRGYVKDLVTVNIFDDSTNFDNLIHNRLNFKWYPNDQLNVYLEFRNRIFWGETVKQIPRYGTFVDVNNDYLDLSLMRENNSVLLHTMIDRAYLEWYKGDWEIRAGRQRINWGINSVWNPNDFFNAFSFFDFDYEERPGSDAIRIKRYTGVASSIEVASNVSRKFSDMVMAGMWTTNRWNYDFQFITGKAQEDIVFGLGWAGNLEDAGFKGEFSYFQSYETANESSLIGTLSIDYSFENSIYLMGSFLYNSGAPTNPGITENVNLFGGNRLTVKDLSPFRYTTFAQISYTFHPLVSGGFAAIYYPSSRNALFINPSVSVSLKPNLDLNIISQLYFDKFVDEYQAEARLIFIRLKWSF